MQADKAESRATGCPASNRLDCQELGAHKQLTCFNPALMMMQTRRKSTSRKSTAGAARVAAAAHCCMQEPHHVRVTSHNLALAIFAWLFKVEVVHSSTSSTSSGGSNLRCRLIVQFDNMIYAECQ